MKPYIRIRHCVYNIYIHKYSEAKHIAPLSLGILVKETVDCSLSLLRFFRNLRSELIWLSRSRRRPRTCVVMNTGLSSTFIRYFVSVSYILILYQFTSHLLVYFILRYVDLNSMMRSELPLKLNVIMIPSMKTSFSNQPFRMQ